MKQILVDTNIIIDYTNGKDRFLQKLLKLQEQCEIELLVNPIIVSEFFTDINLRDGLKMNRAKELFKLFTHKDITCKMGYKAADYLRSGQILSLPDAILAAFSIEKDIFLATRNAKHFNKIRGLEFYH